MPYIVFALGALLSIWGAVWIYFGYGIVEVERGWTGVIAGSTCLAGGLIVIALGVVIKSIREVRNALAKLSLPITETVAQAPPPRTEQYNLDFETGPAAQKPADQASELITEHSSSVRTTSLDEPGPPEETSQAIVDEAPVEPEAIPEPAPTRSTLFDVKAPEVPASKPRQNVTMKPATPFTRKADVPPPEPEPESTPSMDDWLDRAFNALDNEVTGTPAQITTRPGASWPPAADLQPEALETQTASSLRDPNPDLREQVAYDLDLPIATAAREHAPAEDETGSRPEPAHEPAPARASPLVLEPVETGRYETEGTTYIMYSDGSIDMRSETGAYRFASMTELKAYIEGTG